jgi:hypothetical protein
VTLEQAARASVVAFRYGVHNEVHICKPGDDVVLVQTEKLDENNDPLFAMEPISDDDKTREDWLPLEIPVN